MQRLRFLIINCFFLTSLNGFSQTHDLDYFIRAANQNSPVLKDFQQQILSAKIDSQLLAATLKPQVNFISNDLYAPVIKGYGYDEIITNLQNISGLIQVNRNFLAKNNIRAQYKSIALQQRALTDSLGLSILDLSRTVTEQYITAYSDQLTVLFNKEVLDLMQKEEEALKKLTQASVYKQTDYLTFYVTMQQQELTWLQSQVQYNTDYLTLNYLTGIEDTTIALVTAPVINDTLFTDVNNSVFLKRFETDSLRILNEKEKIRLSYQPKLGAYVDGGYNSSLQYLPYKNFGVSAGLSLTVPIYDGHQKELKYAQVNTKENTRLSNKAFFINQYRQQVAQLRLQLNALTLLIAKIDQQINYSRTLIDANNKLLETGDITMKDYVLAINNYLSAKNLLTVNNISRLRILSQLNYWQR